MNGNQYIKITDGLLRAKGKKQAKAAQCLKYPPQYTSVVTDQYPHTNIAIKNLLDSVPNCYAIAVHNVWFVCDQVRDETVLWAKLHAFSRRTRPVKITQSRYSVR